MSSTLALEQILNSMETSRKKYPMPKAKPKPPKPKKRAKPKNKTPILPPPHPRGDKKIEFLLNELTTATRKRQRPRQKFEYVKRFIPYFKRRRYITDSIGYNNR